MDPIPVAAIKIDDPGCEINVLESLLPALPYHTASNHAPVIDRAPDVFVKLCPGLWSQCNTTARQAGNVLWTLTGTHMEARVYHTTHAAVRIRSELSPLLGANGNDHLVLGLGGAASASDFFSAFAHDPTACMQLWLVPKQ
jgi:hypothetical protein